MAMSGFTQAIAGAFFFGLLLQEAGIALVVLVKGHGLTILKDPRRLVLSGFTFLSALWALTNFINFLIPRSSPDACQVTVIFSTILDESARVAIETFLLWTVGRASKSSFERTFIYSVIGLRAIMGALFAGFTRSDFRPVCVPRSELLAGSVTVLAMDAVIVGLLLIRIFTLGLLKDARQIGNENQSEQGKGLILSVVGLAIWSASSAPMILGLSSIILVLRSVLPVLGLQLLIGIIVVYHGPLVIAKDVGPTTPEAQSPLMITPTEPRPRPSMPRRLQSSGSPMVELNFSQGGNLFVVNPSETPSQTPRQSLMTNGRVSERGSYRSRQLSQSTDVNVGRGSLAQAQGNRAVARDTVRMISTSTASSAHANASTTTVRGDNVSILPALYAPQYTSRAQSPKRKRGMFGGGKTKSKSVVRELGISRPIITPLVAPSVAKIRTVDLETAAQFERERRELMAARSLIAQRPAPPPPNRRGVSIVRKELPTQSKARTTQLLDPYSNSSLSILSATAMANSTSSSLSPGREDLRRRSPRQLDNQSENFRIGQVTSAMKPKKPTGLPLNPRPMLSSSIAYVAQQPTVMYMSDIISNTPQQLGTMSSKASFVTEFENLTGPIIETEIPRTSNSIIHRPRPLQLVHDNERAIFPSQSIYSRRKDRTSSATLNRKKPMTINNTPLLPPPQLPSSPHPPTSASSLPRLLYSSSKTTTEDEKIELLFPAPPGTSLKYQRRSSVPSLSVIPPVSMTSPDRGMPLRGEPSTKIASKRATIASVATQDHNDTMRSRPISHISQLLNSTYNEIMNSIKERPTQNSNFVEELPSDFVLSGHSKILPSTFDAEQKQHQSVQSEDSYGSSQQDDLSTEWASVRSYAPPLDLRTAQHNAKPAIIHIGDEKKTITRSSSTELMTIMLDTGEALTATNQADASRDISDSSLASQRDVIGKSENIPTRSWHRRVGDELVYFSERNKTRNSRAAPPTPLVFVSKGGKATLIVAELSPASIDSQERALQTIQVQLKNLEGNTPDVIETIIRHASSDLTQRVQSIGESSLLLENIEKEMGEQQSHWQQMHHDASRDSNSTLSILSAEMSPAAPKVIAPTKPIMVNALPVNRRSRIRSYIDDSIKNAEPNVPSKSTSSSRASLWQQRLAEAQEKYMESAPTLLHARNFVNMTSAQLGSPTPPDSDSDSVSEDFIFHDSGKESDFMVDTVSRKAESRALLWSRQDDPAVIEPMRLWLPKPQKQKEQFEICKEIPARDLRPAPRNLKGLLAIESSNLWRRPSIRITTVRSDGLWGLTDLRPRSAVRGRLTQRPQRMARRNTFLPDIVESPLPLPDNRDTLGLFQFPWGERSDSAYESAPFLSVVESPAYYNRIASGSEISLQRQQYQQQQERNQSPIADSAQHTTDYSSSFFDDYDEDYQSESDSNSRSDSDSDSDDEFDESTLWEIASILQGSEVPSRVNQAATEITVSRRPRDNDVKADHRMIESASSERHDSYDHPVSPKTAATPTAKASSNTLIQHPSATAPPQPPSGDIASQDHGKLWTGNHHGPQRPVDSLRDRPLSSSSGGPGIPQPTPCVWEAYKSFSDVFARNRIRPATVPAAITSTRLWAPPPSSPSAAAKQRQSEAAAAAAAAANQLWSASSSPKTAVVVVAAKSLWAPPLEQPVTCAIAPLTITTTTTTATTESREGKGLFVSDAGRSCAGLRMTQAAPAALGMVRRPQTEKQVALPALTSSELWRALPPAAKESTGNWMTRSIS